MKGKIELKKRYSSNIGWFDVYVYHYVYVLYSNKKPVYVGTTKNLNARLKIHTKDKVFDSYSIAYTNTDRKECLKIEKSLIICNSQQFLECKQDDTVELFWCEKQYCRILNIIRS